MFIDARWAWAWHAQILMWRASSHSQESDIDTKTAAKKRACRSLHSKKRAGRGCRQAGQLLLAPFLFSARLRGSESIERMFDPPRRRRQAGQGQSRSMSIKIKRGNYMRSHMKTLLVGAALIAMGGAALAHHSFAMFDQEHPIDLVGVVKDWKYKIGRA